jgi:hypothetical protein
VTKTIHSERGESFQVIDANGQILAYVYFEDGAALDLAAVDPRRGAPDRGRHRPVAGAARRSAKNEGT